MSYSTSPKLRYPQFVPGDHSAKFNPAIIVSDALPNLNIEEISLCNV